MDGQCRKINMPVNTFRYDTLALASTSLNIISTKLSTHFQPKELEYSGTSPVSAEET